MQVSAVPYGARVFVIAGGASSPGGIEDSFWMQLLRDQAFELSSPPDTTRTPCRARTRHA